jgi:glycogen debranching enzyme
LIISHEFGGRACKRSTGDFPLFLLANKKGSFTLLSSGPPVTRYQGAHFCSQGEFYKVIESITVAGIQTEELQNSIHHVDRIAHNCRERFSSNHSSTLLYEIDHLQGYVDVTLDCRKIYDFSDQGRIYRLSAENGAIIIEYVKYHDHSLQAEDYRIYLVIKGVKEYLASDRWMKHDYPLDRARRSPPDCSWVYEAVRIKVDGKAQIVFAYANSRDEAMAMAHHAYSNFAVLKKSKEQYVSSLTATAHRASDEVMLAYQSSVAALDSFLVTEPLHGIMAGYPWFTQVWTRDEAICLKALMLAERFDETKVILWRQLENIQPDGRVPNRYPASGLGSADGVGWVFLRAHEFVQLLSRKGKLDQYLSSDDIRFLKERLRTVIQGLLAHHTEGGLEWNLPLETWMDTGYQDDTRSGARIEIQALRLSLYRFMTWLCEHTGNEPKYYSYSELELVTRRRVREVFWKKPHLLDGSEDRTMRPNIFLAYYIYPELLSRREWKMCFDQALAALWLPWGGLATIDRNHTYFVDEYTGENNRSYHRGDSWFYLNNLAAVCLHRLDRARYRQQIKKLLDSSTSEILYQGCIGYHAELSSARALRSEASLCQAWSSALYLELVHELFL